MRVLALLFAVEALRLRARRGHGVTSRAAQPNYVRLSAGHHRQPEGGWTPPWAADQCLPFPGGCGHLLHMCGVLSFSQFNTNCTRYGFEVKYAFDECRNASVAHQPVGMLPEMVAFGGKAEDSEDAGSTAAGANDSAVVLSAEEPEEVAFSSCMARSYPSTPCADVCDDLIRASVPLGEVCEESCAKVSSCFSSCSVEAAYPTPVAACVGQCMGPVEPDQAGTVAPVDRPECTTLECQWWAIASKSADATFWSTKAALDNAKNMMTATSVQREMNAAKTTTPEPNTTPFPWDKLKRRLISETGHNPFAAFSPATPLPDFIPTPLPNGEGPVTDDDAKKQFWKPVEDKIAHLEDLTKNTTFNF
jgi:hypothetical protein